MKTNEVLQKDVQDAIKWEPLLNAAEIGVTAKDGIVTLTGTVDSYTKKLEAENATKNVAGVKALVEKIIVKVGTSWSKTDNEIATAALNALKNSWENPTDKIKVKVENGLITLTGVVTWNYQKDAANNAVKHLSGVASVMNNITLEPSTQDAIEKKDVETAIARNWSLGEQDINVNVSGTKVTLTGTVNSLYQKEEAERLAWNTPSVSSVNNELVVEYEYEYAD
jgi:osmotically-inducible protein OsmY